MEIATLTDRTVEVGIFAGIDETQAAVQALLVAGFSKGQISVMCSDDTKERYFREFEHQKPAGTFTPRAVVTGSALGALLGGMTLVGAAIATGSVALWVAGAAAASTGGVVGGLLGAMMTRGVEKEIANYYQQAVIDGNFLVAVEVNEVNRQQRLSDAAEILAAAGATPIPLREG
jgi:hypothetical protein